MIDPPMAMLASRHLALVRAARGHERIVTMDEVHQADEVWITNSSKHIGPVLELDGKPVGDGLVGPVWEKAMTVYEAAKYDY